MRLCTFGSTSSKPTSKEQHVQAEPSRDRQDGRANTVRITAAGKKALKTAQPGAEEVDKQILAVIAPAHRKSFVEALASLAAKLDALENVAAGVAEPEPPRAVKRMRRAS